MWADPPRVLMERGCYLSFRCGRSVPLCVPILFSSDQNSFGQVFSVSSSTPLFTLLHSCMQLFTQICSFLISHFNCLLPLPHMWQSWNTVGGGFAGYLLLVIWKWMHHTSSKQKWTWEFAVHWHSVQMIDDFPRIFPFSERVIQGFQYSKEVWLV